MLYIVCRTGGGLILNLFLIQGNIQAAQVLIIRVSSRAASHCVQCVIFSRRGFEIQMHVGVIVGILRPRD